MFLRTWENAVIEVIINALYAVRSVFSATAGPAVAEKADRTASCSPYLTEICEERV